MSVKVSRTHSTFDKTVKEILAPSLKPTVYPEELVILRSKIRMLRVNQCMEIILELFLEFGNLLFLFLRCFGFPDFILDKFVHIAHHLGILKGPEVF